MSSNDKFIRVPQELIESDVFDPTTIKILIWLIRWDGYSPNGDVYTHSIYSIIKATKIPKNTVRRKIEILENLQIIISQGNHPDGYRIWIFSRKQMDNVLQNHKNKTYNKVQNNRAKLGKQSQIGLPDRAKLGKGVEPNWVSKQSHFGLHSKISTSKINNNKIDTNKIKVPEPYKEAKEKDACISTPVNLFKVDTSPQGISVPDLNIKEAILPAGLPDGSGINNTVPSKNEELNGLCSSGKEDILARQGIPVGIEEVRGVDRSVAPELKIPREAKWTLDKWKSHPYSKDTLKLLYCNLMNKIRENPSRTLSDWNDIARRIEQDLSRQNLIKYDIL